MTPKSSIIVLEPLQHRLQLRCGQSLLPSLDLYLNLISHGGLLQLHQRTITLSGYKLYDTRLEHVQEMGHLILLRSSKLMTKHAPLREHLSDLRHRLCPLSQIQVLLGQPLMLH